MKPFHASFDAIQRRSAAWWRRETADRPLVYVNAPSSAIEETPFPESNPERWWLDPDLVCRRIGRSVAGTAYAGEAFPWAYPGLPVAAFFGATPTFTRQTIWHEPLLKDGDPYSALRWDENNAWWRKSVVLMDKFVEFAEGRFFVCVPPLYSPLDALEMLRGPAGLATDLVDRPEEVRRAQEYIGRCLHRQYDILTALIGRRFEGTAGFLPVWSPRRSFTLQCDFSCMISPQMFREFVVPEIYGQLAWLDHSLYHLDGKGAAKHLDQLLAIPALNGIQWQKGINGGETLAWLPLMKRIQAAGKLLYVDTEAAHVERLIAELSPRGLFIATSCASPDQARALIRQLEKESRQEGTER